ncbi:MAG: aspartyl protease family protein [Saprospiraceae bacterium]|nr:aspartyl protease family protein [Saprospiraceae bacterium]
MKYILTTWLFLMVIVISAQAQLYDLEFRKGLKKVEIPFEYENNFIIVRVIFNDVFPLKFIFDTGAEHTILTRREITDLLQINYERRFPLLGSDLTTELYAYLARGVKLSIHNLVALNRSILVLDEDYFRFEEYGGISVHGIMGSDLFRRFVVKIDFRRKVITLYDPATFVPPSGNRYHIVPLEIHRNKPYIVSPTRISDTTIQAKYLIDTGASLSLLLYTNTHPAFELPPKYIRSKIGMGLGGYLQGFLGRIEKIEIEDFAMEGVITNFQEVPPDIDSSFLNGRNGILGNQILNRFEITIDYIHEKMYIAAEKTFNKKFQYDRSGLIIAASGLHLNDFNVVDIIAGSPAEEAGIQIGDEIKVINGIPTSLMHLSDITKRLQKRVGKKINLVIKRNDERIKIHFRLRNLI